MVWVLLAGADFVGAAEVVSVDADSDGVEEVADGVALVRATEAEGAVRGVDADADAFVVERAVEGEGFALVEER